jgi:hypothetical protein
MNELNENALDTAIKSLSYNSQKRIKAVNNLGAELKLIEKKECTLSARTRDVLVELAERMNMHSENKVLL